MRLWAVALGALSGCAAKPATPAEAGFSSEPLTAAEAQRLEAQGLEAQPPPERSATRESCSWPLFEAYVDLFVEGGRVVDRTAGARSTSEGQAYGLFFALAAGDERLFDRISAWTRDNLLGGTWDEGLPAWLWGADDEGRWGVLDANSATDADLWMAYAFVEAGRLFGRPELLARGSSLLARILKANLRSPPGLGPTLLPGPVGFELEGGQIRLNPSYFVLAHFERFDALGLPGPWVEIEASSARLIRETSVDGHAPDWVVHDPEQGFLPDSVKPPVSSYDAIRVPLFAAFFGPAELLRGVSGRLRDLGEEGRLEDAIPLAKAEGAIRKGPAPPGFYGALLPASARRRSDQAPAPRLLERLEAARRGELYGSPPAYYDQNLVLFGRGFTEGRFGFGARGELEVDRSSARCSYR